MKVLSVLNKSLSYIKYRNYLSYLPKPNFHQKDVVLFFMHPYEDFKAGGILSLYFLLEKSVNILPGAVILPVTIARFPKYTKAGWFNNNFDIYNLKHLDGLLKSKRIIVHVPECFFEFFIKQIEEYKLFDLAKNLKVNILNQNQLYMPAENMVMQHKGLFASITMTLAFAANADLRFAYLNDPPHFIGAWFYGYSVDNIPFESKEEICIISPDDHPAKAGIVEELQAEHGIKCVEIRNMPYADFQLLQQKAKWSISFGEGYDNYFAGAFLKSGVGLSVFNKTFFPASFDAENLPITVFTSYDALKLNLRNTFLQLNNKAAYEAYVSETAGLVLKHSSPEAVVNNLRDYYNQHL